ncbi:MAG: lipoate--protein ligase [Synergistaceae bacterium]|jgi:lipoate-protein ligase A|nr:lipoate--protein ligase [Synergistaceae bacterium]
MYVVENKNTKPQYNLALEEYLCLRATRDGSRFFMLWQNEPSIIVGRFQNTLEEIDTAFVEERGIHVVRRNSGGGAVYHDLGNINYSFVLPDSSGEFSSAFDFAFFTEPIIRALAALGVAAESSGRNDLAIQGKKVSGGAQFRRGGVTLHHGTLLYNVDLEVLSQALRPSQDKFQSKAVKSVRSRVGNIMPFLPSPLPVAEFQERLQRGIQGLTPLTLERDALEEVEKLEKEKYSTWEWNYGASPRFTERKRRRFPWGGAEAFLVVEEGTVVECSFRGDYFGSGDYAPLLSCIVGCPYTKEGIVRALQGMDPEGMGRIFAGSSPEDIVSLLSPEI